MKSRQLSRFALSACIAAALLAGCGGSQLPIGAPGAMPQRVAIAAHADHGTSWMLPEAKKNDLVYVSTLLREVFVLTYPRGKLVGKVGSGDGLCSDRNGNVFVVSNSAQDVIEYAHGKSHPIKVLDDEGNAPWGCAVDPASGNLAVAGGDDLYVPENVAVYANASGPPTVYTYGRGVLIWCTYDNQGNIFATSGFTSYGTLVELPKGSGTFHEIYLDKMFGTSAPVQWDGHYLALENTPPGGTRHTKGPTTIYQVQLSGSTGTVVNTITLVDAAKENKKYNYRVQFWIHDGSLITPRRLGDAIGVWRYPSGGSPVKKIAVGNYDLYGVTLSNAKR